MNAICSRYAHIHMALSWKNILDGFVEAYMGITRFETRNFECAAQHQVVV
jgi:hypothetical protein